MYPVAFLVIATREREREPLCDVCNLGDLARTKGATWSSKQMLLDDLWMFTGMFWIFNDLWMFLDDYNQHRGNLGNFEDIGCNSTWYFFLTSQMGWNPDLCLWKMPGTGSNFSSHLNNLVYSTVSLGSTLMAAKQGPFAEPHHLQTNPNSIFLLIWHWYNSTTAIYTIPMSQQ